MNRKILIFVIFVVAVVVLVAVKINSGTEVAKEYFPEKGDIEEGSAKDFTAEIEKEVEAEMKAEKNIESIELEKPPFMKE